MRTSESTTKKATGVLILTTFLLPLLLLTGVSTAQAATSISFTHAGHGKPGGGGGGSCTGGTTTQVTSTNWAGYAVQTCLNAPASGAVNAVQGSWVQPSVSCAAGETSYSAFWVGIDGYSSSTVEQIGTDSDCSSGVATYYAWYEMYPKLPVNLALSITPGNTIQASVHFIGSGKFVLTIQDLSNGQSYSTTQISKKAVRSSAEWVTEAPSGGSVLPLADFGTVTFSGCTATLGSVTGPINDAAWENAQMTMTTSSNVVKASTSSLSSGGESFSNTWEHS